MKNNILIKLLVVGCILFSLSACISKAPKTTFYSLTALPVDVISQDIAPLRDASLGVGPIVLPEYVRSHQVVSFTDQSRLHVAANAAWAGDIDANLTRVLSLYLSDKSGRIVESFPWDNRARPDYQLLLRFNKFGGIKGKHVSLNVNWQLINIKTKQLENKGVISVEQPLQEASTQSYIAGINKAIKVLSQDLARVISVP